MIREASKPITITTDIIVGFPGETESEFEETLSLLEEVQYDSMFSFKYSPRPNTPSLSMSDSISEEEKGRRLAILQDQDRKSTRLNSSHSQISYAVFCLKKKKK